MTFRLFLVISCLFFWTACSTRADDHEDGIRCIDQFFDHIAAKDYSDAVKLIDPQSNLYQKRDSKILSLGTDSILGDLILAEEPPMISATTTVQTSDYSMVSLSYRLVYDSSYRMVRVQAINKGNGYRIHSVEQH